MSAIRTFIFNPVNTPKEIAVAFTGESVSVGTTTVADRPDSVNRVFYGYILRCVLIGWLQAR